MKALQIIDAARAVGVTLSIDGDSLLLRSGSPPPGPSPIYEVYLAPISPPQCRLQAAQAMKGVAGVLRASWARGCEGKGRRDGR